MLLSSVIFLHYILRFSFSSAHKEVDKWMMYRREFDVQIICECRGLSKPCSFNSQNLGSEKLGRGFESLTVGFI